MEPRACCATSSSTSTPSTPARHLASPMGPLPPRIKPEAAWVGACCGEARVTCAGSRMVHTRELVSTRLAACIMQLDSSSKLEGESGFELNGGRVLNLPAKDKTPRHQAAMQGDVSQSPVYPPPRTW